MQLISEAISNNHPQISMKIWKQESIPVECQSPACQLYVPHNEVQVEQAWTYPSGHSQSPAQRDSLSGEVQCFMGNGHMGPSAYGQNDRQTRLKTFPSHNFVGGR